ncbi:MYND finger domain containing protein [Balamuthia mandrillaris]
MSKGRTLLFEHLPYIRFGGSMQGVLFLVFANGEAYFYPLNEKTKGDAPSAARMITLEPSSSRKFVRSTDNYAGGGAASMAPPPQVSQQNRPNDKYFVYDVALSLCPEFKVFTFPFVPKTTTGGGHHHNHSNSGCYYRAPKKLLLSPNKRLLLVHGALHKGQSCLLIYQIMEESPPFFRLIFYDQGLTFLDACFSPDSKSLVTIPSRYPCFIFLLNLNFVLSRVGKSGLPTFGLAAAAAATAATRASAPPFSPSPSSSSSPFMGGGMETATNGFPSPSPGSPLSPSPLPPSPFTAASSTTTTGQIPTFAEGTAGTKSGISKATRGARSRRIRGRTRGRTSPPAIREREPQPYSSSFSTSSPFSTPSPSPSSSPSPSVADSTAPPYGFLNNSSSSSSSASSTSSSPISPSPFSAPTFKQSVSDTYTSPSFSQSSPYYPSPFHFFDVDEEEEIEEQFEQQRISFDPRVVGPLAIIGPATGAFGQPLEMTHIASSNNVRSTSTGGSNIGNSATASSPGTTRSGSGGKHKASNTGGNGSNNVKPFHFVTWNDAGNGEYCLWTIIANRREKETIQFEWYPRLLFPKIMDRNWLEEESTPKNHILDIQFSAKEGGKLMLLVRRENFGANNKNGIGLQMVKLTNEASDNAINGGGADTKPGSGSNNDGGRSYWFQCTESLEIDDILALKWTNTLLLGTNCSAAIIIKGKGMFELVDYHFASSFQTLYDDFVRKACNFIQVGRYHRFWTDIDGKLNVMVVTPQIPSCHPEWAELFDKTSPLMQQQFLNMRHLGRRIGYHVTDIRELDTTCLEKIYAKDTRGKGGRGNSNMNGVGKKSGDSKSYGSLQGGSSGNIDAFFGMHLYRCWSCRRTLLKPLQCGRCKLVVYCSRHCQEEDWPRHKQLCALYALPSLPYSPSAPLSSSSSPNPPCPHHHHHHHHHQHATK